MQTPRQRQITRIAKSAGFKPCFERDGEREAEFSGYNLPNQIELTLWSFQGGGAQIECSLDTAPQVSTRSVFSVLRDNAALMHDLTERLRTAGYVPKISSDSEGYIDAHVGIRSGKRGANLHDVRGVLQVLGNYLTARKQRTS
jgi:hypothetical protein